MVGQGWDSRIEVTPRKGRIRPNHAGHPHPIGVKALQYRRQHRRAHSAIRAHRRGEHSFLRELISIGCAEVRPRKISGHIAISVVVGENHKMPILRNFIVEPKTGRPGVAHHNAKNSAEDVGTHRILLQGSAGFQRTVVSFVAMAGSVSRTSGRSIVDQTQSRRCSIYHRSRRGETPGSRRNTASQDRLH